MIFKRVWRRTPVPRSRLRPEAVGGDRPAPGAPDQLVTTKRTLTEALLEEDSTFYGDLFAHVVSWRGELYLEDGLHRALRAARPAAADHACSAVLDLKATAPRCAHRNGGRAQEESGTHASGPRR